MLFLFILINSVNKQMWVAGECSILLLICPVIFGKLLNIFEVHSSHVQNRVDAWFIGLLGGLSKLKYLKHSWWGLAHGFMNINY